MSKRAVFSVSVVICGALIVLFVSATHAQEPGLADSSWPMLYNNPQLTKVADTSGPENVGTGPDWERNYGICWTTPHQSGEDDPNDPEDPYLFVTMKLATNDGDPSVHTQLRKIRTSDGLDVGQSPVDMGPTPIPVASSVSPLIIKENLPLGPIVERLYTQQRGKLRKWDTDLNEITNDWPALIQEPNPDPGDDPDLIPYAFTLSNNNRTLIGAASTLPRGPTAGKYSVLFAIDKYDGEDPIANSKQTFDIHQWFMDHKCTNPPPGACNQCSAGSGCFDYPSDKVIVKNSVPIARDPDNPLCELVFVLTAGEIEFLGSTQPPKIIPGYLLAVIFDTQNRTFGPPLPSADPVKWKFEYTPPESNTSPVVSMHPTDSTKDRVYFVSGEHRAGPFVPASLYSIRTSDGKLLGITDFDLGGVPSSPVVEYRSDLPLPGPTEGNMIYALNTNGPTRGFLDSFSGTPTIPETLRCKWRTGFDIFTSGGVCGKAKGGLYYTPFKKRGESAVNDQLYGGAFDPDDWSTLTPDSSDPCEYIGEPIWEVKIGERGIDQCTRSIAQSNLGKPQVFFGHRTTLYAVEEQ